MKVTSPACLHKKPAGRVREARSMYALYRLAVVVALPFFVARDLWQELRGAVPRGRWRQRLGWIARPRAPGCIWIHAVSVGEVQAASGLVTALRRRAPGSQVVVTTVTATGAETTRA